MSGKRRKISSSISISLFSFQDIITSLSGIMILLVLFIAVDIATQTLDIDGNKTTEKTSLFNDSPIAHKNILLKKEIKILKKEVIQYEQELLKYHIRQNELQQYLIELTEKNRAVANQNRTISFIPTKDIEENKHALLIECSGEYIRFGMLKKKEQYKKDSDSNFSTITLPEINQFSADQKGIREFVQYLQNFDKARDYLLLFIKPSASSYAMSLVHHIQVIGFDTGYDAISEDESIDFDLKQ